jgi:hypothetical protein
MGTLSGRHRNVEPGVVRDKFLPSMSKADFEKQFGSAFLEPGFFARFVGIIGNLFPNVGPLKSLPYKPFPEKVRQLYFGAFGRASEQYRQELVQMSDGPPWFPDLILDTGKIGKPGAYAPADKAYADLLRLHAKDHFVRIPKPLADDMLKHFRDETADYRFRKVTKIEKRRRPH